VKIKSIKKKEWPVCYRTFCSCTGEYAIETDSIFCLYPKDNFELEPWAYIYTTNIIVCKKHMVEFSLKIKLENL
jgi:hypothetical protein